MNRLSSSHSAPDHREEEEEVPDWGSPSFGISPEPTVESPASSTGRGWGPRSGSGFRGEASHRGGRTPRRVVPSEGAPRAPLHRRIGTRLPRRPPAHHAPLHLP